MKPAWLPPLIVGCALMGTARGRADAGPGGADAGPEAGTPLVAEGGAARLSTCVERVPEGKERPTMTERLPGRGTSGHATWLELVVEHGKGEQVLPNGFRFQLTGDDARAIEDAGFVLPDPDGGAAPTKSVEKADDRSKTRLRIAFVPLPKKPGRQELTLPPLPIAVERASGELMTLCTKPHSVTVEDPTANAPSAEPRANPPPKRQLETWSEAKHVTYAALLALLVGALVAWLVIRWRRRPKRSPPPPPPRPPWEVALEELHAVRHAGLIREERFGEHFDRVSDAIRRYLGDRYGFDGLESTTRESLALLARIVPPVPVIDAIKRFLRQADLVKFARLTPTEDECMAALEHGENIVRRTIPPTAAHTPDGGDPGPGESEGETTRGSQ